METSLLLSLPEICDSHSIFMCSQEESWFLCQIEWNGMERRDMPIEQHVEVTKLGECTHLATWHNCAHCLKPGKISVS